MLLVMNSLNQPITQPTDDLDAVIGRFQAWSVSQTPLQAPKTPIQSGTSEISYEQALRATARYRRPEEPLPAVAKAPSWIDEADEDPIVDLPTLRKRAKTAEKVAARKRQQRAAQHQATTKKASAPVAPADVTAPAMPKLTKKESFAQVLKKETSLATTRPTGLKASALTVRLSRDESELIKARADEANLSTSAYLRQCALEVESLREQVRTTLAQLHTSNSAPILESSPSREREPIYRPSVISNLKNWVIRRLGGQAANHSC